MARAGKQVKIARKRRVVAVHGPARGPLTSREFAQTAARFRFE